MVLMLSTGSPQLVIVGNAVLTQSSIVESVKDDVEWVKAHPLITDKVKKGCQGFVFDIRSGKVERVEV